MLLAIDGLQTERRTHTMNFDDADDNPHMGNAISNRVVLPCQRCKELEAFLRRMLNPEDMGLALNYYARDEVRAMLGMQKCEHLEP